MPLSSSLVFLIEMKFCRRYQFSNTMAIYACRLASIYIHIYFIEPFAYQMVSQVQQLQLTRTHTYVIMSVSLKYTSYDFPVVNISHRKRYWDREWDGIELVCLCVVGLLECQVSFQCDKYDAELVTKKVTKKAGAFKIMPSQQLITFLTLITLQSGGKRAYTGIRTQRANNKIHSIPSHLSHCA